jgi:molecular chaperone DnaK
VHGLFAIVRVLRVAALFDVGPELVEAIDDLKEAIKGSNLDDIKAKLEALTGPLYELTSAMYQKTGQQPEGDAATGGSQAGGAAGESKDNVVDADFEVKEDK